jgi:hypothetical protein
MERKGLFTPAHEDFLAGVLDDLFKFKNPLIEKFDRTFFKIMVSTLDNQGLDRLNPEWKADIIPIIDAGMAMNVEETRRLSTDLLNKRVDIPKVDEETELMVFDAFTRFIVAAIDWYVQKKQPANPA